MNKKEGLVSNLSQQRSKILGSIGDTAKDELDRALGSLTKNVIILIGLWIIKKIKK